MHTRLETPIQTAEFEPRTAESRSFFIDENELSESELWQRTQLIHGWQAGLGYPEHPWQSTIGFPEFKVEGVEGIDHATISTGVEPDGTTAIWQINVTNDGKRHIVHGQITEEGESWELVSVDHQGRLRQEGLIHDDVVPGALSSFVLGAISRVPLLEVTADRLLHEKRTAATQYGDYLLECKKKDKHGYGDKKITALLSNYVHTGFSGSGATDLEHVIAADLNTDSRRRSIARLPDVVKRLLASTDYDVIVPASAPHKHL